MPIQPGRLYEAKLKKVLFYERNQAKEAEGNNYDNTD